MVFAHRRSRFGAPELALTPDFTELLSPRHHPTLNFQSCAVRRTE